MQTVSSSDSCSEAIIRVSPVCMYPCKLPACEDSKVPLLCFSFGVQTYIHSMPVYEAPNNNTTNSLNTAGPIVQLDLMRGHAKIQCMEPLETCRMNQTTQYLHNNVKTPCLMNTYDWRHTISSSEHQVHQHCMKYQSLTQTEECLEPWSLTQLREYSQLDSGYICMQLRTSAWTICMRRMVMTIHTCTTEQA